MLQRLLARVAEGSRAFVVAAVVLPLVVTVGLAPLRSTADEAVVALLLVAVVTTLAALGGRTANFTSVVVGAVAFDLLHTTPYGRLAMDDPTQIQVLVVFLVVAIVLGELSTATLGAATSIREAEVREARVLRVLVLSDGESRDDVVAVVLREVRDETSAARDGIALLDGLPPRATVADREGRLVRPDGQVVPTGKVLPGPWYLDVERGGTRHGAIEVHTTRAPDRARLIECWTLAQVLATELSLRHHDHSHHEDEQPVAAGPVEDPDVVVALPGAIPDGDVTASTGAEARAGEDVDDPDPDPVAVAAASPAESDDTDGDPGAARIAASLGSLDDPPPAGDGHRDDRDRAEHAAPVADGDPAGADRELRTS